MKKTIQINGKWFTDRSGRVMILRGVNLGGSSKVPRIPNGATHLLDNNHNHREVSFVGRPFALDQADQHFERLKTWGFDFLRFIVTWEAIEHRGPGSYDTGYLDYLCKIIEKAGQHGINLFVDPHQDLWSRLSGGCGAPGWTFEAIGLEPSRFSETCAALLHTDYLDMHPSMYWVPNYKRYAAATMFTLFYGGNDFAPLTKIDGEPAQEYLQRHFFNALKQVVMRLKSLPNVIGYECINEPSPGYIGWPDLNQSWMPRLGGDRGVMPTPYQSMLLTEGYPQEVDVWENTISAPERLGKRRVNPRGVRAWRAGYHCVWKENGVWSVDRGGKPRLDQPDYFSHVGDHPVNFVQDYVSSYIARFAREIHAEDTDAAIFAAAPMWEPAFPRLGQHEIQNFVNAAHWYDPFAIESKFFSPEFGFNLATGRPILGKEKVWDWYAYNFKTIKEISENSIGDVPVLVGEFGVCFDMNGRSAYRTGDFSMQEQAMDAFYSGLEKNLLSSTIWNYTSDNDNCWGDQWNGEDFSIYSEDQRSDPGDIHSGGRALRALVRPYARKTSGKPISMSFDYQKRIFQYKFEASPQIDAPTEIFVPRHQYPNGYSVEVTDGKFEKDQENQVLIYWPSSQGNTHRIIIKDEMGS